MTNCKPLSNPVDLFEQISIKMNKDYLYFNSFDLTNVNPEGRCYSFNMATFLCT